MKNIKKSVSVLCLSALFFGGAAFNVLAAPKNKKLTNNEETLVLRLHGIYGKTPQQIAKSFPKSRGINARYIKDFICSRVNNNTNRPYSKEEDRELMRLVKDVGTHWDKISKLMPGRSSVSVKNRYKKLARKHGSDVSDVNSQSEVAVPNQTDAQQNSAPQCRYVPVLVPTAGVQDTSLLTSVLVDMFGRGSSILYLDITSIGQEDTGNAPANTDSVFSSPGASE